MSEALILYLPDVVSEELLQSWISVSDVVISEGAGPVQTLAEGKSLYIGPIGFDELALSYEGSDVEVLNYCAIGRRAWSLGYRDTAGSIRQLVAHIAERWPLYVDTDSKEVLTGAAFVRRLLENPEWDLADGWNPDGYNPLDFNF